MNEALLRALTEALEAELAAIPVAEAGRVFSAKNEAQLRQAVQALQALLAQVSLPPDAPDMPGQQPPPPGQQPPPPGQPAAPRPVPAAFVQQQQSAAAPTEGLVQEAVIPLAEAAVKDGKSLIRIITPGWGTSGFYSPTVLERDSPGAFPRGTKMFWDHPTTDEAAKRPERSLRDLAAELTEDARYLATGPEGPGVYSRARVFSGYQPAVEELAPHIGVSIRASALTRPGEADGRKGPIIERLIPSPTNSVDFVTIPGRGGRIASLFEAARGSNQSMEGQDMGDEAALKAALEAQTKAEQERDRALLALAMRDARDLAAETVGKVDLPAAAKARLVEAIAKDPPITEGALDRDALTKAAEKAAADEKAYLAGILGTGTVRGMGSGSAAESGTAPDMTADFQRLGLSEAAAKTAAAGRKN